MPVIHVHLLAGRKVEQKRAFVKKERMRRLPNWAVRPKMLKLFSIH